MDLFELIALDRGPGAALLKASEAMGFAPPVARQGLEAEFEAWTAAGALERVRRELSDAPTSARLPKAVLIVAARTLPASTLRQVLFARMLGARVILKPASGQAAIAEAIGMADAMVRVLPISSEDHEALDRAIAAVDAVVVLGSDATVHALRARVPASKAFVGYGHRLSAAWLETWDDSTLEGLAQDLCAWDQAGCLSPQVAWVQGDPTQVAERLAAIVQGLERALPMQLPDEARVARVSARTYAQMVGVAFETTTSLVAALPSPDFRPSPGHRCLWVLPASRDALRAISGHLSTLALTGAPVEGLPEGVRYCAPGEMQRPPLDWRHDAKPNLRPMLCPAEPG